MRILAIGCLLLASCSSNSLSDNRVLDCGTGREIGILAGMQSDGPRMGAEDQLTVQVEVSNYSHDEVTVSSIRIQQMDLPDSRPYEIDPAREDFDVAIPDGQEHLFEIKTSGRATGRFSGATAMTRGQTGESLSLDVFVSLTNGDSYHCRFAVGSLR